MCYSTFAPNPTIKLKKKEKKGDEYKPKIQSNHNRTLQLAKFLNPYIRVMKINPIIKKHKLS